MAVSNERRLLIMCTLTFTFFLAEIVVGYMVSSLALISDAFHMLSDLLSIIVAIVALRMKEKSRSEKMTYGWVRAEVLGGLINGVFLLALCFNILIEAIQRFFKIEEITQPVLLLIVASVGLLFNIIGLLVFAGHASAGGHSHSHGHSHKEKKNDSDVPVEKEHSTTMHSVFLHVLGDAFGSIAVIGSALFIWLTDFSWRFYVDPVLSILLSSILIRSSIRLVKNTSLIMLHRAPVTVDLKEVREKIEQIPGVLGIHELHAWQLDDTRNICTAHIASRNNENFMTICQSIKDLLHKYGIHNVTIQPEYIEDVEAHNICSVACKPECVKRVCCSND